MPTTPPTAPSPAQLLTSTARSTFEQLALLFAEPLGEQPGGAPALGTGAVGARVAFAGVARGESVEGALTVRVGPDVAAALAENMLGGGATDPAALGDAVGELANVVCGHVLSDAAGPEAVFTLTAPARLGDADAGVSAGAWAAWLDVEGGRACVTLEATAALFAA